MQRLTATSSLFVCSRIRSLELKLDERGLEYEIFDYEAERDRLWELHDPRSWKKEAKARAKAERKRAEREAEEAAE